MNLELFPFCKPDRKEDEPNTLPGVVAGTSEKDRVVLAPIREGFWDRLNSFLPAMTDEGACWGAFPAGPVVLQLPMGLGGVRLMVSSLRRLEPEPLERKEEVTRARRDWPGRG